MSSNVRRIHYLVVLAVFFSALVFGDNAAAKQVTLGPYDTADGKYDVTFDTSRIPEEQMKQFVLLSPALSPSDYMFAPSLELCITRDPRYRDCGSRKLDSPNFFSNAEVNLDRGREVLQFLSTLSFPKELQKVVRSQGLALLQSVDPRDTVSIFQDFGLKPSQTPKSRYRPHSSL